jgi:hypothetical protein
MAEKRTESIPLNRPLTEAERRFLTWLLEHGATGASAYIAQIPEITVIRQCGCGCPTLDLAVAGKHGQGESTIVADFLGMTQEQAYVGVMVHVREGVLSELEAYTLSDITEFTFPRIEVLRPFGPPELRPLNLSDEST